jgi:rhamnogalacturonan acetylesterase
VASKEQECQLNDNVLPTVIASHLCLSTMLCLFLIPILSFAIVVSAMPKLLICSDSTAASYQPPVDRSGWQGWGFYLGDYLTIPVKNFAEPGESTRSFIRKGSWVTLLSQIVPGDLVIIEMGHNDEDDPLDPRNPNAWRGTLPGIGDNTAIGIDRSGTSETVLSFGGYLRLMIADVRARAGIPILSGRTPGNDWNGDVARTDYKYSRWAEEVSSQMKVEYLDHTKYSIAIFQEFRPLGRNVIDGFYAWNNDRNAADLIHNNAPGALCKFSLVTVLRKKDS